MLLAVLVVKLLFCGLLIGQERHQSKVGSQASRQPVNFFFCDFGWDGRFMAEGYITVDSRLEYNSKLGFGFTRKPNGQMKADPAQTLRSRVLMDGITAGKPAVLRVDLPNGTYEIKAYVPAMNKHPMYQRIPIANNGRQCIRANGVMVVDNSETLEAREIRTYTKRVDVTDGKMLVEFFSSIPGKNDIPCNGIEITPVGKKIGKKLKKTVAAKFNEKIYQLRRPKPAPKLKLSLQNAKWAGKPSLSLTLGQNETATQIGPHSVYKPRRGWGFTHLVPDRVKAWRAGDTEGLSWRNEFFYMHDEPELRIDVKPGLYEVTFHLGRPDRAVADQTISINEMPVVKAICTKSITPVKTIAPAIDGKLCIKVFAPEGRKVFLSQIDLRRISRQPWKLSKVGFPGSYRYMKQAGPAYHWDGEKITKVVPGKYLLRLKMGNIPRRDFYLNGAYKTSNLKCNKLVCEHIVKVDGKQFSVKMLDPSGPARVEKAELFALPGAEYFSVLRKSVETIPPVELRDVLVNKVTYRTLKPTVKSEVVLFNNTGLTQSGNLHLEIRNNAGRVIAKKTLPVQLAAFALGKYKKAFKLTLGHMQGLVLVAKLDIGGASWQQARAFDCTDNFVRNFRWGGYDVSRLIPREDKEVWARSQLPYYPYIAPIEGVGSAYRLYQNVLCSVNADECRGHSTPWEERKKPGLIQDGFAKSQGYYSMEKLAKTARLCKQRGIIPQSYLNAWGAHSILVEPNHPWVNRMPSDTEYHWYGWSYIMNSNPNINHPLSPAEKKLMRMKDHGAKNWADYMVSEAVMSARKLKFESFWWDNWSGMFCPYRWQDPKNLFDGVSPGDCNAYVLKNFLKKLNNPDFVVMANASELLREGPGWEGSRRFHGTKGMKPFYAVMKYANVFWLETPQKPTLDEQRLFFKRTLQRKHKHIDTIRSEPLVISWSNSGQPEYSKINLKPDLTHMYRQLLFETIATSDEMVDLLKAPRKYCNSFYAYPKAMKEHMRTYAFMTYNIDAYNLDGTEPAAGVKISSPTHQIKLEDDISSDALHVMVRYQPKLKRYLIHVFNYYGTTMDILKSRPRPMLQKNVELAIDGLNLKNPRAYSTSPDNEKWWRQQSLRLENGKIKLPQVDTYTLLVIQEKEKD